MRRLVAAVAVLALVAGVVAVQQRRNAVDAKDRATAAAADANAQRATADAAAAEADQQRATADAAAAD